MKTIQENLAAVESAKEVVCKHPMCLRFIEDRDTYLVLYPEGYQLDGVRASKSIGRAKALAKMHDAMERHWNESYPGRPDLIVR